MKQSLFDRLALKGKVWYYSLKARSIKTAQVVKTVAVRTYKVIVGMLSRLMNFWFKNYLRKHIAWIITISGLLLMFPQAIGLVETLVVVWLICGAVMFIYRWIWNIFASEQEKQSVQNILDALGVN